MRKIVRKYCLLPATLMLGISIGVVAAAAMDPVHHSNVMHLSWLTGAVFLVIGIILCCIDLKGD